MSTEAFNLGLQCTKLIDQGPSTTITRRVFDEIGSGCTYLQAHDFYPGYLVVSWRARPIPSIENM